MCDVYTENVLLQCGERAIPWAWCPLYRPGAQVPQAGQENWPALPWDAAELTQFTTVKEDGGGDRSQHPRSKRSVGPGFRVGPRFVRRVWPSRAGLVTDV